MQVKDWELAERAHTLEVSAAVDGFRLWFRVPERLGVSRSGDPFLAAALIPAMLKGETLQIDPRMPVSKRFLNNIQVLQDIFHCWNPVLQKIEVIAESTSAEPINAGAFSFFSGGVDSTYTFLKRLNEISHALFIQGFDFYSDSGAYTTAIDRNRAYVESYGKTLIPVETNHYPFGYRYNLSRNLTHGSCLGAIALLLGFPTVFVPASCSYNRLYPLGSHPLTDPLWSNECMTIIHDGCEARRTDKVRMLCEYPTALKNLRVCFMDMNVNCGACEKCLRTMISLRHFGIADMPFPPLSYKAVRNAEVSGDIERAILRENVDLVLREGDRASHELRDALRASMRRSELKQLAKDVDRVLFRGLSKRILRAIQATRASDEIVPRIDTTP